MQAQIVPKHQAWIRFNRPWQGKSHIADAVRPSELTGAGGQRGSLS